MDRPFELVELFELVEFAVTRPIRLCVGFLFFGCMVSVSVRAEVRQWTAKTGQTMEAEYVKMAGGTVIFRRDKKLERHPLDILSDLDQAYVKHQGTSASRSWFVDGRSLRGIFQSYATGSVTLRIGASNRDVPLGDLSSADQSHIRGILELNNKLSALPEDDLLKLVAAPADAKTRQSKTWTDKKGRSITAEFVRVDFDKVVLRRTKDGKELVVPLSKLSDEDQAVAKERQSQFAVVASPATQAAEAAEKLRLKQEAERVAEEEAKRLAESKKREEEMRLQKEAEEERRRAAELAEKERLKKAEELQSKQLAEEKMRLAEQQALVAAEAERLEQERARTAGGQEADGLDDPELAALDDEDFELICPACEVGLTVKELEKDGENCPHCGVNFIDHYEDQFDEEFSGGGAYHSYRRTRRLIRFGVFVVLGILGLIGRLFAGRQSGD